MKYLMMLMALVSMSSQAYEKEDFYNKLYCADMGGTFGQYHRDTGATRAFVDCETEDTVWEGEWANKAYEAVGQALWYSTFDNKTPGIIFYMKHDKEQKYINRAIITLDRLGIEYKIKVIKITKEE